MASHLRLFFSSTSYVIRRNTRGEQKTRFPKEFQSPKRSRKKACSIKFSLIEKAISISKSKSQRKILMHFFLLPGNNVVDLEAIGRRRGEQRLVELLRLVHAHHPDRHRGREFRGRLFDVRDAAGAARFSQRQRQGRRRRRQPQRDRRRRSDGQIATIDSR